MTVQQEFEKSNGEELSVKEFAMARLLSDGVIILGNYWYKHNRLGSFNQSIQQFDLFPLDDPEWPNPEDAKLISVNVICNDTFLWGTSDCEALPYDKIEELYNHHTKDKLHGALVWCCKRRGYKPQKPLADAIRKLGIWDIDNMGLKDNPTDADFAEDEE